jgi:hypothetical protein
MPVAANQVQASGAGSAVSHPPQLWLALGDISPGANPLLQGDTGQVGLELSGHHSEEPGAGNFQVWWCSLGGQTWVEFSGLLLVSMCSSLSQYL